MRFIEDLCSPALLYLIFLVVSLGLDLSLGLWFTFIGIVVLLNTFCGIGLSPVSWFLVAIPFLVTALATAISMGTGFDSQMLVYTAKEGFKPGVSTKKIVDRNPALPGVDPPVSSSAVENVVGV